MTAYLAGLVFLRFAEDKRCADLDATALVVLAAMASYAAEQHSPVFYGSQDSIVRRARVKRTAVQRALRELAVAGVIERSGKEGKTVRWRLSLLSSSGEHKRSLSLLCSPDGHKEGGDDSSPNEHKNSSPNEHKNSSRGGHKTTESPEVLPSRPRAPARDGSEEPPSDGEHSPVVRVVLDATDATPEEAVALVEEIRREGKAKDLGRFIAYLARNDELEGRLSRLREDRRRRGVQEWIEQAKSAPECEHGVRGGDLIRPDTGLPHFCAQCREEKRKASA